MSPFHIRPASVEAEDSKRIIAFFDSQLPWLSSVGSGAQWGSKPFSGSQEHQDKYLEKVKQSERSIGQPPSPDWIRVYIAEADVRGSGLSEGVRNLARTETDDGMLKIPVAAMVLEYQSVDYVRDITSEQDAQDPFIYLSYLLSDRRAESIGKGAGQTLLEFAKVEARKLGMKRICCDCWRGNDNKLVKYYQKLGFTIVGEFGSDDPEDWPGSVLELRL